MHLGREVEERRDWLGLIYLEVTQDVHVGIHTLVNVACISYLVLCNRSVQNLMADNNNHWPSPVGQNTSYMVSPYGVLKTREVPSGSHVTFYDSASKVTQHHFCYIRLVEAVRRVCLGPEGERGPTSGWSTSISRCKKTHGRWDIFRKYNLPHSPIDVLGSDHSD